MIGTAAEACADDADVLIREARARAHRRRIRIAVAVVLAGALAAGIAVAVQGGGGSRPAGTSGQPVPAAAPASPQLYAAVGTISVDPAHYRLPQLCYGATAAVLRPGPPKGCSGIPLRALDIAKVPGLQTHDGVSQTGGPVRVVGTYRNGTLTVTRHPTQVSATPVRRFPIPCATPPGGWTSKPFDTANAAVFERFGQQHPDTFGGFWLADGSVPVVTVTRGIEAARQQLRQQLRQQYAGDFCVGEARYTERELNGAADRITKTLTGRPNRFRLYGWGYDPVTSTVNVDLVIVDDTIRTYFRAHFPADMIRFDPLLKPVAG